MGRPVASIILAQRAVARENTQVTKITKDQIEEMIWLNLRRLRYHDSSTIHSNLKITNKWIQSQQHYSDTADFSVTTEIDCCPETILNIRILEIQREKELEAAQMEVVRGIVSSFIRTNKERRKLGYSPYEYKGIHGIVFIGTAPIHLYVSICNYWRHLLHEYVFKDKTATFDESEILNAQFSHPCYEEDDGPVTIYRWIPESTKNVLNNFRDRGEYLPVQPPAVTRWLLAGIKKEMDKKIIGDWQ